MTDHKHLSRSIVQLKILTVSFPYTLVLSLKVHIYNWKYQIVWLDLSQLSVVRISEWIKISVDFNLDIYEITTVSIMSPLLF